MNNCTPCSCCKITSETHYILPEIKFQGGQIKNIDQSHRESDAKAAFSRMTASDVDFLFSSIIPIPFNDSQMVVNIKVRFYAFFF